MNIPKEFFENLTRGDNVDEPLLKEEGDFFIAPANFRGDPQNILINSDSAGRAGQERIFLAKANLSKKHPAPEQAEEDFASVESDLSKDENFAAESVGQLVVDVYQTADEIIIQSTIAGVDIENLDISVSGDTVAVKGKRSKEEVVDEADYFCQECYWGNFQRTIILPAEIEPEKTRASLKNGILTIRLPKAKKNLVKKIKIVSE